MIWNNVSNLFSLGMGWSHKEPFIYHNLITKYNNITVVWIYFISPLIKMLISYLFNNFLFIWTLDIIYFYYYLHPNSVGNGGLNFGKKICGSRKFLYHYKKYYWIRSTFHKFWKWRPSSDKIPQDSGKYLSLKLFFGTFLSSWIK